MQSEVEQGPAPEDDFTLIPNSLSRSSSISLRAKAVYICLKSHRDGWKITTDRVAKSLGMSKNTVASGINDLIEAGYVRRVQIRAESGKFSHYKYVVLSTPDVVSQNVGHGDATSENTVSQKVGHGDDGQLKNCADASSKSELHKKTISKKTKTPPTPHESYSELIEEPADEKQGGENQSPASGADAPKPTGEDETYRLALAIFNGWVESRGASFDKDTCNGFGRHIIDALDDGVGERAIVSALRLWDESGDSFSPGRLPSLIAKVQAGAKSADESAQLARLQREKSEKALAEQRERNARTRQQRKQGRGLQSALAARNMNSLDDALRKPEEPATDATESDETPPTPPDPQTNN